MARISRSFQPFQSTPNRANPHLGNVSESPEFRFTPRPMIKKATRIWDRKPATPVRPRSKSHKIWKRVHASKDISDSRTRDVHMLDLDSCALIEEINLAKSSGHLIAVKKQCVRNGVKTTDNMWEMSFVETRLEMETLVPRHKYVIKEIEDYEMEFADITSSSMGLDGANDLDLNSETRKEVPLTELTAADSTKAFESETRTLEKKYQKSTHSPDSVEKPETPVKKPSAIATLLKQSILEEDDAELFSNFLSQAQAKRDANTTLSTERLSSVTMLRFSAKQKFRRALENLDKNSPSTLRQSSPSKAVQLPSSPLNDQENVPDGTSVVAEDKSPSTPSPKKRGRPSRRVAPRIPDNIPLRRSNGTEFVFKQKTESQQLALLTKSNTKQNKGSAKLPHLVLHTVNEVHLEMPMAATPDLETSTNQKKKAVAWNDDNLVTFAEETTPPVFDSPDQLLSSSRRSSRRLASVAPLPATPLRSTAPRKVRKLGTSQVTSINKEALENIQVMTPPTVVLPPPRSKISTKPSFPSLNGTPIPKRKKLTPASRKVKDVDDGAGSGGVLSRAGLGRISRFHVKMR